MANIMRLGGGSGGGTTIGVSYNADGTQNLVIKDDGSVIEIPDPNPVLLWTNASPTSDFNAQTLNINGAEYAGYIVEIRWNNAISNLGYAYIPFSTTPCAVVAHRNASTGTVLNECCIREVKSASKSNIVFGTGVNGASRTENAGAGIPTRIWGVKFTL